MKKMAEYRLLGVIETYPPVSGISSGWRHEFQVFLQNNVGRTVSCVFWETRNDAGFKNISPDVPPSQYTFTPKERTIVRD